MKIAKITGSVVATKKEEGLVGSKLMIVRFQTKEGEIYGDEEVAVDYVGAGVGEIVLVASGSATRTRKPTMLNLSIWLLSVLSITSINIGGLLWQVKL